STIDPSKALPSAANGPAITNIDFRRGANGEGKILVNFDGAGADAEMVRKGNKVLVTIQHANLPANLGQRLDTTDFATPVQSIATHAGPMGGARMEIAIKGEVETSSYQTANQYVIEVAPKKANTKEVDALSRAAQAPVYTGKRVTINFQDIPVRSALQLIAENSGLNLVASDSVGGSVTLRLVNVPWDQVLDVILRAKSLDKRSDGNVIWIAPQQELAKYEDDVAQARLKAQDNAELITTYIPISYGKASQIATLLTTGSKQGGGGSSSSASSSRGFLSRRGSVSFDERTNTLLINDTPEKLEQLRLLISKLDRPVQQVLIESRIVVANDDFSRELGVRWGVSGHQINSGNIITTGGNTAGASKYALDIYNSRVKYDNALEDWRANGGTGAPPHPGAVTLPGGLNVNLPATAPAGSLGLAILGANYALDLELSAAQTEGRLVAVARTGDVL
ncbi:MAG: type IV pilus secretin PilQ, partial [Rhodanobacter sp.]